MTPEKLAHELFKASCQQDTTYVPTKDDVSKLTAVAIEYAISVLEEIKVSEERMNKMGLIYEKAAKRHNAEVETKIHELKSLLK